MTRLLDQKIDHQVSRDGGQPTAKAASRRIHFPIVNRTGHGQQNFLRDFTHVRVLQVALSDQPLNQRLIDIQKICPRLLIPRIAEPHQQAGPSFRNRRHSVLKL